ncbi:MAG TPA: DUF1206 domain-containing protein [Mycobacteriales bacterium]
MPDRTAGASAGSAVRTALRSGARVGLVARAVFYLLLAYLTLRVAALSGHAANQVDANGALRIVAGAPADKAVLGAAGAGFALFGLVRLRAAWTDDTEERLRRVTTAIQGVASLVVAYIPFSYALGNTRTGTEQQTHRSAAHLLGLPGGRVIVVAVGFVVLGWAAWQVRGAIRRDYAEGLDLSELPPRARRAVVVASGTALAARALVIAPIGIFLVAAGLTYDANHVRGLDGELLLLTHHPWGTAVLALIALGLLDFAAYALVEARYRKLDLAE